MENKACFNELPETTSNITGIQVAVYLSGYVQDIFQRNFKEAYFILTPKVNVFINKEIAYGGNKEHELSFSIRTEVARPFDAEILL